MLKNRVAHQMLLSRSVARVFLFLCLCVFAQSSWSKATLALGQRVYEKMQEAQAHIGEKHYDQAFNVLDEILAQKRLNDYERAQTISMYGNVYYQMEKYPEAYREFQKLVGLNGIPDGFKLMSLRTLSQLAFMLDDYDNAIIYANKSLEVQEKPDPSIYILIAQIHYRKEDFAQALVSVQTAIALKRGTGEKIPEGWLLILNAVYYSTNAYENMLGVLKELIELYPKKSYILNLAAIYGQLDNTKEQLLLTEPLWDKGLLDKEQQLVNLAHLLMLHKVPYKASKVLEQGFKEGKIKRSERNLDLIAQAWQLAAEDDLSLQYLSEAAALSKKGEAYFRLAQGYMNLYRWTEAEKALTLAIKSGGLKNEGNTYLMLGMVEYYQKSFRSARKTFKKAAEFDKTEKLAEQWIAFVDREKEKYESAL